jgi:hypothetical protein
VIISDRNGDDEDIGNSLVKLDILFIFKVTVSTILSDFLNRIFSPKLEQME